MNAKSLESSVVERLLPELSEYSVGYFALANDLIHLDAVRRAGASDAAVFYCARILEILAADALKNAGLSPSANCLSNLDSLQKFHLIPTTTRYWAHSLRRMGNSVRHMLRPLCPNEVEVALEFIERILNWFFCSLPCGPKLASITVDGGPVFQGRGTQLHELIEAFDRVGFDPSAMTRDVEDNPRMALLQTPTLPAVLAEMLLERDDHHLARRVLVRSLQLFGDDLRLRQLMGLLESRDGHLQEALNHLESIYKNDPDDEESAGILAGVYKRIWDDNRTVSEWLEKSNRAYTSGWTRSRYSNAYLGINAASTALWLGRPSESRVIAFDVCNLLRGRADAIQSRPEIAFDYWDRVSLAEAELLCGQLSVAREIFDEAFKNDSLHRGDHKVTRKQLGDNLPHLGLSLTAEGFLDSRSRGAGLPTFVVGVSGHRKLPADGPLAKQLHEALQRIVQWHCRSEKRHIVVLSALAEGADRLVAKLVLSPAFGGSLCAVLPLEIDDYCTDFQANESVLEFRSLLNEADSIIFPSAPCRVADRRRDGHAVNQAVTPLEERQAAYTLAGQTIIERSEALVVIWDGAPARGPGGTGDFVLGARQAGKSLVWVQSSPPYEIKFERMT